MIFVRSTKNPILRPTKNTWENFKVYNPGCIYHNNKYHLFYRAVGRGENWYSSIGYAVSADGINFERFDKPLLSPKLDIEKKGLEDPRITKVGTKFYMTYTAYDGQTARLCLAVSQDLKSWQRQGEIFPSWDSKRAGEFLLPWDTAQKNESAKHHWLKTGAIFPEKINGKYRMFFGDRLLWCAESKDGTKWTPEYEPLLSPRYGYFDSVHVEMGPPPIRTKKGWLVLYHGIDENITYRLGYLLLGLHNTNKIIRRSATPIFEPSPEDTKNSQPDIEGDSNIIFCNGAIRKDNIFQIYYGAGDSVINTASADLNKIL
jgi:predicted GH43/DUF377 family glycosyl hydrolase